MAHGGKRIPGKFNQGTCLVTGCNNPYRASNLCSKHYAKYYYSNQPGNDIDRGRKHFRRNSIAYEVNLVTGIPFLKARKIVRIILDIITKALQEGKEVYIPGFGYFGVHKFNRFTHGQSVYFWPARELKSLVNKWSLHQSEGALK